MLDGTSATDSCRLRALTVICSMATADSSAASWPVAGGGAAGSAADVDAPVIAAGVTAACPRDDPGARRPAATTATAQYVAVGMRVWTNFVSMPVIRISPPYQIGA